MTSMIIPNILLSRFFSIKPSQFTILNYLDTVSLNSLQLAINRNSKDSIEQTIRQLIRGIIIKREFIDKIDRSMFYSIFDEGFISEMDQLSILNIAHNSQYSPEKSTLKIITNFNILFNDLKLNTGMNSDQVQAIKQMVTDPVMSLPILLRDRIGKHFNSIYQTFVYTNTTDRQFFFNQTSFSSFKNLITQNEQKYMIFMLFNKVQTKDNKITNSKQIYFNFRNSIEHIQELNYLHGNQIYNFVVILLKIVKNMLLTYKIQVKSLSFDPYAQFIDLNLRFSAFKNFILQIEEELGLIFGLLQQIHISSLNSIQSDNFQSFSIGELLMCMFRSQMKSEISQSFSVYMSLMKKLRIDKQNRLPERVSQQQKRWENNLDEYEGSLILSYLLQGKELNRVKYLLCDFSQMLVDMSVDRSNICWNGHSSQKMITEFMEFQDLIIQSEIRFIKNNVFNCKEDMEKLIIEEIGFLKKNLNIKPRTLKALLVKLNTNINYSFQENDSELEDLNFKYNSKASFKVYESQNTSASQTEEIGQESNSWEYISQASEHNLSDTQMEIQI